MDLTGQQLAEYRVLRRLGRGAMAEVYLAEQPSLARQVALKVLNPQLASDAGYVEPFQHEARAAAALVHSGIVQIYEVGQAGGYHFIAQEYVAGRNLGELIERQGRLDAALTLDVLRQVASALLRAAERGIVHRDIKPENVMLARSGEVKVADFGLARVDSGGAKLTQVGVTMGTPLYMSPEQVEGRSVDARSDLYSLGVTAYHMLAGEPPFRGENAMAVAVQQINGRAKPLAEARPDAPPGLVRIVEQLMSKSPSDRPESPAALLAELHALTKQAAEEGWSGGVENWSITELAAVSNGALSATSDLGRWMHEASRASADRPRWGRALGLVALACIVGGAIAAATRPTPLLANFDQVPPRKESVQQQLFHAKWVGREREWRAVADYWPDADSFYHHVADQHLVALYLRRDRHDDALQLCRRLGRLDEQTLGEFRLFGEAGEVVALSLLGDTRAAQQALDRFPIERLPELQDSAPEMATMLVEARDRLSGSPGDAAGQTL